MRETTTIEFKPFRLDLGDESLWRQDERLRITPKAFAVLRYLVEHADQLVTRDDLFAAVWPESYMTDDVLTVCIRELRRVMGDWTKSPQYIATVRGRGYRFIAPVAAPSHDTPSSPALSPPLIVARERELATLHARFDISLRGERQIVFIASEAGIGKTTLVDAFVSRATARMPVWLGRGQPQPGLRTLAEALDIIDARGQDIFKAEAYRLKGELLLQSAQPNAAQAETCFRMALDISRRQRARPPELRAATSLARLLWQQDKREHARDLLAPIYGGFTEGFDTADLQEAKALLDTLSNKTSDAVPIVSNLDAQGFQRLPLGI